MAYNIQAIQMQRTRKDQAARNAFRKSFSQTLFIEPADLQDGDYQLRLWPEHQQKCPLGYLYYRVHTLELASERDVKKCQCPRSSNWDPFPMHYTDDLGNVIPPEAVDLEKHLPVYKVRCWPCEIAQMVAQEGLQDSFSESISKRVLPALWNTSGWADHYFFPATFQAEIAMRNKRTLGNGKIVEDVDYRPAPGKFLHCVLKLRPGTIQEAIFEMIAQVPDLNNLVTGRWLTLRKQNGGKGAGGYQLFMGPYPSQAGFEIKDQDYMNFQSWGAGSTKRPTYEEIEAIAAFPGNPNTNPPTPPGLWWGNELRQAGLPLTDAEANSETPF